MNYSFYYNKSVTQSNAEFEYKNETYIITNLKRAIQFKRC